MASGHRPFHHSFISLLDLALVTGRTGDADAVAADLLDLSRAGALDAADHHMIGESLEEHDRPKQAHRWFTIVLRDEDPDDLDALHMGCLHGRFRVRRELGLPLDAYDRASEELNEIYAAARE